MKEQIQDGDAAEVDMFDQVPEEAPKPLMERIKEKNPELCSKSRIDEERIQVKVEEEEEEFNE